MCSSRSLSVVGFRIMQLPATSAAVEKTFSTYGNIQSAKRNRLTVECAGKLVYISQNVLLIDHGTDRQSSNSPEQQDGLSLNQECQPPYPQLPHDESIQHVSDATQINVSETTEDEHSSESGDALSEDEMDINCITRDKYEDCYDDTEESAMNAEIVYSQNHKNE